MSQPGLLKQEGDGGHGPLTLMLSMNLIILALFIMLNSVAQQASIRHGGNSRAAPLAGQVGYAHSGPQGVAGGSSASANLDTPAHARQVHDDLQGQVANTLRLDAPPPDADSDARRVRVTLTPGQFFVQEKGVARLTKQGQNWLENLAAVLSGPARGWQGSLQLAGNNVLLPVETVLAGQALGNDGLAAVNVGYVPAAADGVVLTLSAPAGVIADRGVERLQQVLQTLPAQIDGLSSKPGADAPPTEAPTDGAAGEANHVE